MTLARRVTANISGVVVRYASPGCKEWAEGLAREAEFIEDDMSALRWAMGSTRVLLDRREAPITSLADVPDAAQHLSKLVRKGTVTYAFLFMLVFIYALRLLNAGGSSQQRISCGVAVLTAISLGVVDFIQRRTQRATQAEDVGTWALYYRSELERQRDFYFNGSAIHFESFAFFIFIGCVFAQDGGVRGNPIFFAYQVLVYLFWESFIYWRRWQFQHRIDELDAIVKGAR
jgi:hypothetical protein